MSRPLRSSSKAAAAEELASDDDGPLEVQVVLKGYPYDLELKLIFGLKKVNRVSTNGK